MVSRSQGTSISTVDTPLWRRLAFGGSVGLVTGGTGSREYPILSRDFKLFAGWEIGLIFDPRSIDKCHAKARVSAVATKLARCRCFGNFDGFGPYFS